MNVLNELRQLVVAKSEFPEEQVKIDTWASTLEEAKNNWKGISTFLQEQLLSLDTYGRGLMKPGSTFKKNLTKLSTQHCSNLCNSIKCFGDYEESIGGSYYRQVTSMNTNLNHKINELRNDFSDLKKVIVDDGALIMKDLSTFKSLFNKNKLKYDKAKKEVESSTQALDNAKNEPSKAYEYSLISRYEERMKSARAQYQNVKDTITENVATLNQKEGQLQSFLQKIHEGTVKLEHRTLQTILELFERLCALHKNVQQLRNEQIQIRGGKLNELANITLDMISTHKDQSADRYPDPAEHLNQRLEARLSSSEDRKKVLRSFAAFLTEIVQQEEQLIKSLQKLIRSCPASTYLSSKSSSMRSWVTITSFVEQIGRLHYSRANVLNKQGIFKINEILNTQNNLSQRLSNAVSNLLKDLNLVQDNCRKEYEKIMKLTLPEQPPKIAELKEKLNKAVRETELKILSLIADNSNLETSHIQSFKQIILNLQNEEENFAKSYEAIIEGVRVTLDQVDIYQDFEDIKTYKPRKKSDADMIVTSKESVTIEDEEEEEKMKEGDDGNIMMRFGLAPGTSIIETFSCALFKKILLHGRMYIAPTHVCFLSAFNPSTIFGRETSLVLPINEIVRVEKKTHMLIFDNALSIFTQHNEFYFTSFMYRDQAFATIDSLLKTKRESTPIISYSKQPLSFEFLSETRKEVLIIRKQMRKSKSGNSANSIQMVPQSLFIYNLLENPLTFNIPAKEVFKHLFKDEEFVTKYLKLRGDTDIQTEAWNPAPPSYYLDSEGDIWNSVSKRKFNYVHPVGTKMPMMPKSCNCIENQEVFFISKTEFILDSHVNITGLPGSDTFQAHMRWHVTEQDGASRVTVEYGVEFFKRTWISGTIEKSGMVESKDVINKHWVPLASSKVNSASSGEGKEVEVIQPPQVIIQREEFNPVERYALWGMIAILMMVVLRLWRRVSYLEDMIYSLETKS